MSGKKITDCSIGSEGDKRERSETSIKPTTQKWHYNHFQVKRRRKKVAMKRMVVDVIAIENSA